MAWSEEANINPQNGGGPWTAIDKSRLTFEVFDSPTIRRRNLTWPVQ